MKNTFKIVCTISCFLLLFGCSLPQPKEKQIHGRQYIDPNVPSINVEFPFEVYSYSENTIRSKPGDVEFIERVTTLSTDNSNIYIHIDKLYMPASNAYFTGCNYEKEKLFYEDKRKNGDGCFVYYKEIEGKSYLIGDVITYKMSNTLNNIRILEYLPSANSYHNIGENYSGQIDSMIDDIKYVCKQVLK